jgi:hypothetical protein
MLNVSIFSRTSEKRKRADCCRWGPEGVIRRVSNPNDKKRKRVDQGDQCNPM